MSDDPRSDEQLMADFYAGETEALNILVSRPDNYNYLMGTIFLIVGDRHTAEDMVQEVWLKVLRTKQTGTGRYDPMKPGAASVKTWLVRIARNEALRWIKRPEICTTDDAADIPDQRGGLDEPLPLGGFFGDEGKVEVFRQCWQGLHPFEQALLILHDAWDVPVKDLAENFQVPAGTLSARMSRARKKIRDCMREGQN